MPGLSGAGREGRLRGARFAQNRLLDITVRPVDLRIFKNLKITLLSSVVITAVVLSGAIFVGSAMLISYRAQDVGRNWDRYQDENSPRALALNSLVEQIGYGGMIHAYKNFILRKDSATSRQAERAVGAALAALNQYESVGIDSEERAALENLRRVILQYAHNLEQARVMASESISSREIDAAVKIDDMPALNSLDFLKKGLSAHQKGSHITRAEIVEELRTALGYGGLIHLFKNYLLRQDETLMAGGFGKVTEVRGILALYRGRELLPVESAAIADIAVTVDSYETALHRAQRLVMEEYTPEEIDDLVRVDDGPALDAMRMLITAISTHAEEDAKAIAPDMDAISDAAFVVLIVAFLSTLLLVGLSSIVLRLLLVKPLEGITEAMSALAHGDHTVELDRFRSESEIGQMAEAVQVFKLHDIERLQSEKALRESREELSYKVQDLETTHRKLEEQSVDVLNMSVDLQKARDVAEESNRVKSEFLASMSHELRTPLNAIIGFSEIIKNELFGPIGEERYQIYVKDIFESGTYLLSLINDILDLSKAESGKDELFEDEFDVFEISESALNLIRQRAMNNNISIVNEVPDDLPLLFADQRKVKQILVNLMTNSVKFTESGGSATLKAWHNDESGFVFQVVDTGIGMDPEDIPKALSAFRQIDGDVNRQYEGTGLGLALSKKLTELHGGSFDVQSERGIGTTVSVRFPAHRIVGSGRTADGAA